MCLRQWIMLFTAVFLLMTLSLATESVANPSVSSKTWDVDVELRSSIYLPTPRPVGDVFIVLNNTTPDLVYRIERSQADDPANLAKAAYATRDATPHDPYKIMPNSLGPFPRGADLGFTLGEWLAATGTGTYAEENDNSAMNFTFRNLVPNGDTQFIALALLCHPILKRSLHLLALLTAHKMHSKQMLRGMQHLIYC